jgi:hypothetical protein
MSGEMDEHLAVPTLPCCLKGNYCNHIPVGDQIELQVGWRKEQPGNSHG